MDKQKPKVGDSVWLLNQNRRMYRKDSSGRGYGSPIHAEMWEEDKIVSETSRSWIIGDWRKIKVPKSGRLAGIAFSREEADQISYVADNQYRVSEMVRRANFQQLKAIESILSPATE